MTRKRPSPCGHRALSFGADQRSNNALTAWPHGDQLPGTRGARHPATGRILLAHRPSGVALERARDRMRSRQRICPESLTRVTTLACSPTTQAYRSGMQIGDPVPSELAATDQSLAAGNSLGQVGARLHAFRQARQLSVRKTAIAAGVSPSFVSQLERGKSNASVAVLQRLCDALEIHISDLFDSVDVGSKPVKSTSRRPLDYREGIVKYLITPSRCGPLAWYDAEFDASAHTGEPYSHHGIVETVMVLANEVTVQLADDAYILKPGDSISFSSETAHRISNHTTERSRIHWLCAPVIPSGNKDVHPENEHSAHLEDPEGRNPDERE